MKKPEPGMLCRVVSSVVPENNGKVITLVDFVGTPPVPSQSSSRGWSGGDWWEIDAPVKGTEGSTLCYIRACRLQPINPDHQPADEDWQADFKRMLCGDKQPVNP